jgi:murein DD-endopeptidase MepM/ murein hydrolase activator NlpD
MRDTIEESGLADDVGFGKSIYTELFDQELSRSVAQRGALGIADLLYNRLAQNTAADQEGGTPNGESGPVSSKVAPAPQSRNDGAAVLSDAEVPDFRLPVKAPVSSGYGVRTDPFTGQKRFHSGIDLAAPAGTQVLAPWGGKIVSVGSEAGYGNYVVVQHPEGFQTRYAHLGSASVRRGDPVTAGEVLGTVGSSGRSTGPHLHFEIMRDGRRIDPKAVLAE